MAFGQVHVGLWMTSPEEVEVMLRSIEGRLRNIATDDPDRPLLEKWRKEAMNMKSRSDREEWAGWR